MPLLPLFVDLLDRPVLLVGGGATALAKLEALRATGARVKAVARHFSAAFPPEDAQLVRIQRAFEPSDLEGVLLVISATDVPAVNASVADEARRRNVLVNAVDDPPSCDTYFASTLRRGPWTLALSTAGTFPGLSRALRRVLEELIPESHDDLLAKLVTLRAQLRHRLPDPASRGAALTRLLEDFRRTYLLPEAPHV